MAEEMAKGELLRELARLRQRLAELEKAATQEALPQEGALMSALEGSLWREAKVEALLEGARAVLEHREFPKAARALFDICQGVLGAQVGYMALVSEDGTQSEVLFLESGGLPCGADPKLSMPIRGLREEVYRSGRAQYENDFSRSEWARFLPEGHVSLENVLFVPLPVAGKVAGLMGLANKSGGFTEADVELAMAFGELVAMALLHSRTREALEESEKNYRTLVETMAEALSVSDEEGALTYVNSRYCELTGYARDELIGRKPSELELFSEEVRQTLEEERAKRRRGERGIYEIELIRKDGRRIFVEAAGAPLVDSSGRYRGSFAVFSDITQRKLVEEKLFHAAMHDPLTGLPNRALFYDRLAVELSRARRAGNRVALMMLDLDRFKEVNDALGHSVGDELLRAVGHRLRGFLRGSDTIARMGGDEFILVIPEIGRMEEAAVVAGRVLAGVREPFSLGGCRVGVTTSLGVAIYPDDGEDADALVQHADRAMYRAKEEGRDRWRAWSGV